MKKSFVGIIIFAAIVGVLVLNLVSNEAKRREHQNTLKEVKGAMGWNLGDVLPDNLQVKTNDFAFDITHDFDPPADMTNAQLDQCYLVLTENRQITEICVSASENDQFNMENLKKALTDKYGLSATGGVFYTEYYFGKYPCGVVLYEDNHRIYLVYKNYDLDITAAEQQDKRRTAAEKQIQNNLKGHL
jgi:hypothetical protein